MRGVGCADETLKPKSSRGSGAAPTGAVVLFVDDWMREESDETAKATLRWWIRWETRR